MIAGAPARLALVQPGAPQPAQVFLQSRQPPLDPSAIHFELGLARSPGADAAGLLGQLPAAASQAGEPVAKLGQFHLGLALKRRGVLGEDVKDHRCAVERSALQNPLQVELLRW